MHLISGATVELPKNTNTHRCFSVAAVEEFVPRLVRAGVAYENWAGQVSAVTLRADGVKQIHFRDPDGYWLEVNDAKE